MNNNIEQLPAEQPSVFFDHPIVYVDSYDTVERIVAKMGDKISNFVVIAESGNKIPTSITKLSKEKSVQVVRIRASGSWNSLYRLVDKIEGEKLDGKYPEVADLMFLSFHDAHAISAALKRHRAFSKLTSRELYYLSFIDDVGVSLDVLNETLRMMPNVTSGVSYADLSTEQRFKLSAFEFARYLRPVHCAMSLDYLLKNIPFYEGSVEERSKVPQ